LGFSSVRTSWDFVCQPVRTPWASCLYGLFWLTSVGTSWASRLLETLGLFVCWGLCGCSSVSPGLLVCEEFLSCSPVRTAILQHSCNVAKRNRDTHTHTHTHSMFAEYSCNALLQYTRSQRTTASCNCETYLRKTIAANKCKARSQN